MESFTPKKVDESWKDSVRKESQPAAEPSVPDVPETDFLSFMSTLAVQALASLGEMSLKPGEEPRPDLAQAQYLIDTIQMLADRTRSGNSREEAEALDTLLYELRLKFVAKKQSAGAASP